MLSDNPSFFFHPQTVFSLQTPFEHVNPLLPHLTPTLELTLPGPPTCRPLPNEQSPGSVGALIKRFQRASEADTEQQIARKRRASERVSGEAVLSRIDNERRKSDTHASLNQVQPLARTSNAIKPPLFNPTSANPGSKDVGPALEPPSSLATVAAAASATAGGNSSNVILNSNTNSSNVEQPTTVEHPVPTPPNSVRRRSGASSSNMKSLDEKLLDAANSPVATEFTGTPLINDAPQVSQTKEAAIPPLPAASSLRLALATTGPAELLLSPSLHNDSTSSTQEVNQGVKTIPRPYVTEEDAGRSRGHEEQDNEHNRSDLERYSTITTTASKSTVPHPSSPLNADNDYTDTQHHLLKEQEAANETVSHRHPAASKSSNVDGGGVMVSSSCKKTASSPPLLPPLQEAQDSSAATPSHPLSARMTEPDGTACDVERVMGQEQSPLVHGETRSSASLPLQPAIRSGSSGLECDVKTGDGVDPSQREEEQKRILTERGPSAMLKHAQAQDPPRLSSPPSSFSTEEGDHAKSAPPGPVVDSLLLSSKQESSPSPPHQSGHNHSPIGPQMEETDPLPRNEEDRIPEGQMEALMPTSGSSSVHEVVEGEGVSAEAQIQEQEQRSVNERKESTAAETEVMTKPSQSVQQVGDVKHRIKQVGQTRRPITTSATKTHGQSAKATTSRSSYIGKRSVDPTVPPRLKAAGQGPLIAERKSTVPARSTSQRPAPTSLSSSTKPSASAALPMARETSSIVGGRAFNSATGLGKASLVRPTGILPSRGARSVTTGQRQTRDSGAFTRGKQATSTVAATSLHTARTTIDKGTAHSPVHAQRLITSVHRSQGTINQPAKPLLRSLLTSSVTDITPRKRERTSLYAPTASSLAKARSKDTNKNMVSVVHKAALGGGQRIRGGDLAQSEL